MIKLITFHALFQRTSTGEIKVIERFDCSGCGDVDTSTTCEVVDGCIIGITGRKLQVCFYVYIEIVKFQHIPTYFYFLFTVANHMGESERRMENRCRSSVRIISPQAKGAGPRAPEGIFMGSEA